MVQQLQLQQQEQHGDNRRPKIGSFLIEHYQNYNERTNYRCTKFNTSKVLDGKSINPKKSDNDMIIDAHSSSNEDNSNDHVILEKQQIPQQPQPLPSLLRDVLLNTTTTRTTTGTTTMIDSNSNSNSNCNSNSNNNNNHQNQHILLHGNSNTTTSTSNTNTNTIMTSLMFDYAMSLASLESFKETCRCGGIKNNLYNDNDEDENEENYCMDHENDNDSSNNHNNRCSCVSVVVFRLSSGMATTTILPMQQCEPDQQQQQQQQQQQENSPPPPPPVVPSSNCNNNNNYSNQQQWLLQRRIQIIYVQTILDIIHYLLSIASIPYHRQPIYGIFIEHLDRILTTNMMTDNKTNNNSINDSDPSLQHHKSHATTRMTDTTTIAMQMTQTVAILMDTILYISKTHQSSPPSVVITLGDSDSSCTTTNNNQNNGDNNSRYNDGSRNDHNRHPSVLQRSNHTFQQMSSFWWSPLSIQIVPVPKIQRGNDPNDCMSTSDTIDDEDNNNNNINNDDDDDDDVITIRDVGSIQPTRFNLTSSINICCTKHGSCCCDKVLAMMTINETQEKQHRIFWTRNST